MTALTLDRFPEFYTLIHRAIGNGNRELHPWQKSLVSRVGEGADAYARIPSVIAPTGAGKSFITTLHLYLCAVSPSAPPRIVMVMPRRGLVDQMNEEATRIVEALSVSEEPLLVEVRDALRKRHLSPLTENDAEAPIAVVNTFRGGAGHKRPAEWADDPNICTILSATPHMAISTLLSRSFGFAPKRHAAYAGLFAIGTVMVFDEAHIQRQAVRTARSVAALVDEDSEWDSFTDQKLSVIEMTATPSPDMDTEIAVTIGETDVSDPCSHIAKVLTAPKIVEVVTVRQEASKVLTEHASDMRKAHSEGTVAVVVNTVGTALKVTKALRKEGYNVVPITGRVRGADRQALLDAYPGVLTSAGNPDVDIVVATQTIEVGIDADFVGMVTEVASGDALTQRFGRVNRHGKRSAPAPIIVTDTVEEGKSSGIYSADDLQEALQWLRSLEEGKASPLNLKDNPPPVRKPDRAVVEKFHRGDALRVLLNSGQTPAVYDSPEHWFSDSVDNRPETRILIRRGAEKLDLSARSALLSALRPQDEECWNVSASEAESVLKSLWNKAEDQGIYAIDIRKDNGDVVPFASAGSKDKPEYAEVGWSTVVIWAKSGVKMLDGGALVNKTTVAGIPAKDGKGVAYPVPPEQLVQRNGSSVPTTVYLLNEVPRPTAKDIEEAAELWGNSVDAPYWVAARKAASGGEDRGGFVLLGSRGDNGVPQWAVVVPYVTDDTDNPGSGDTLSSTTTSTAPVLLSNHRADVAAACAEVAEQCGITDYDMVEAVRLAGLYHDDGKAHSRFQKMLKTGFPRGKAPSENVAKSPQNAPFNARPKTEYGLPLGWRHEQLSAAIAAHELQGSVHQKTVSVLAGLTHGYGRLTFPHGWSALLSGEDIAAEDIFTDGTWEQWVSDLTRLYGPWHLAWLEALVRAADHTVSAQGH